MCVSSIIALCFASFALGVLLTFLTCLIVVSRKPFVYKSDLDVLKIGGNHGETKKSNEE